MPAPDPEVLRWLTGCSVSDINWTGALARATAADCEAALASDRIGKTGRAKIEARLRKLGAPIPSTLDPRPSTPLPPSPDGPSEQKSLEVLASGPFALVTSPAGFPSALTLPKDFGALVDLCHRLSTVEVGFECGLTFVRVLQGAVLEELRKQHGKDQGGRPAKTSKAVGGFQPWPEFVKKSFGFSDETARARIELWKAARPRLKKLADEAQIGLSAIFERPISSLQPAEFEAIQQVTRKLTDGKTVAMIQQELGLYKGEHGGALQGNKLPRAYHPTRADGSPRAPKRTAVEIEEATAEAACAEWARWNLPVLVEAHTQPLRTWAALDDVPLANLADLLRRLAGEVQEVCTARGIQPAKLADWHQQLTQEAA